LEITYPGSTPPLPLTSSLPSALSPPNTGWWHLALQIATNINTGVTSVGVYINGYLLANLSSQSQQPVLQLTGSQPLTVGGGPSLPSGVLGFTGWIDEFKVIARDLTPDPETICNHARGTLAGVNSNGSPWYPIAFLYLGSQHTFIANQSHTSFTWYACYHDYSSDQNAVSLWSPQFILPPTGTGTLTSVRTKLHSVPLYWNLVRPDVTQNTFCLSCHTSDGSQASTTLQGTALTLGTTCEYKDSRRQPMHPARWVFGNIPAKFINNTYPQSAGVAPTSGYLLDQAFFPHTGTCTQ
jgi:hypothetical protein